MVRVNVELESIIYGSFLIKKLYFPNYLLFLDVVLFLIQSSISKHFE